MSEHPSYEMGKLCEFRADGKLRGGKILEKKENTVLVGYYGPKYQERWISTSKIKLQ